MSQFIPTQENIDNLTKAEKKVKEYYNQSKNVGLNIDTFPIDQKVLDQDKAVKLFDEIRNLSMVGFESVRNSNNHSCTPNTKNIEFLIRVAKLYMNLHSLYGLMWEFVRKECTPVEISSSVNYMKKKIESFEKIKQT